MMKRSIIGYGLAIGVSATIALGCGYMAGREKLDRDAENLRTRIEKEVPRQASHVEVQEWLRRLQIEHSYLPDDRRVEGIVRNVNSSFFVRGSLRITFSFDDKDILEQWRVEPVYTGP